MFKSKFINNLLKNVNSSKFTAGIAMLMLNVGSKYVSIGLSKSQEAYLTSSLARQILIFSATFVGTKDIVTSILLTIVFILFADYIFNENSRICVLPKTMKKFHDEVDIDKDGIISDEELKTALDVLSKARKRKQEQSSGANYLK
mgnify:CR=1 FL=1